MLHDVIEAIYQGDYRVELQFDDDARGVVDFSRYVDRGGVFERFKDVEFFRSFRIDAEAGTISWGDEIEIAPETLYAEATGAVLPDWMRPDEETVTRNPLRS
jgi:hypothetical protein